MKVFSKTIFTSLGWLGFSATAFADDLFATGWGATFNQSSEGVLLFTLLQCVGIFACFKSLRLLYAWHHGKQNRYGNGACLMMFLAGCLLFYGHQSINLIYNTL